MSAFIEQHRYIVRAIALLVLVGMIIYLLICLRFARRLADAMEADARRRAP